MKGLIGVATFWLFLLLLWFKPIIAVKAVFAALIIAISVVLYVLAEDL